MGAFVGIVFDGIAYGSLLFLISVGLSVTMGLMNFVNLAHGMFAMMGGFLSIELTRRAGMPFLLTLPVVFLVVGLGGAGLELVLYRRLYRRSHLDQVLFTIGLSFMAGAAATWVWGPSQQPVQLPAFTGRSPCLESIWEFTGCSSSRSSSR
jgi:branched-chain amino acid transport system permease protein